MSSSAGITGTSRRENFILYYPAAGAPLPTVAETTAAAWTVAAAAGARETAGAGGTGG
ncbi:hypothetical protein Vlu01_07260 [Micromonospora lutea]|uniref:Uncharacterized protein n=1 Tax=Micromonospora lutea TaxID=419825 RepID=A0ABQ4IQB6_9ACTN|nr:hypothetical protein Vlu01_07260 [Micromonospora lutea]